MSIRHFFKIFAFSFVSASIAFAQSDELGVSIADGPDEQKSKRRAYAGGRDEEDLKVQTSLPQPSRDPDMRAAATSAPADEPAHD
ncbi:MAG: hypothetical protein V4760_19355 [Bdellovibrionota bacterium]